MKRLTAISIFGFVLLLYILAPNLLAQQRTTGDKIGNKFVRGVVNTSFGWMEIPNTVYYGSKNNGLGHGASMGLLEGIGNSVVRTSAGVYDLVTFLIPYPGGYKPIIQPEFVFNSNRNDYYSSQQFLYKKDNNEKILNRSEYVTAIDRTTYYDISNFPLQIKFPLQSGGSR